MMNVNEPAAPSAGPPAEDGRQDADRMVRADLLAAIVLIAVAAVILYVSWNMPRLEVRRVHPMTVPGLVPGLLSATLLLCGILLALRSLRAGIAGGWGAFGRALVSEPARRVLAVVALVLVYTLGLVGRLPFWMATAIFVFAFIVTFELWLTPRRKRALPSVAWAFGLAIATSVTVTYVFERLFLVRLP